VEGRDTGGDDISRGDMFGMGGGRELATSCVVRAARVILMLFSEIFCLSCGDSVAGILRRRLCLGRCPETTTSGE